MANCSPRAALQGREPRTSVCGTWRPAKKSSTARRSRRRSPSRLFADGAVGVSVRSDGAVLLWDMAHPSEIAASADGKVPHRGRAASLERRDGIGCRQGACAVWTLVDAGDDAVGVFAKAGPPGEGGSRACRSFSPAWRADNLPSGTSKVELTRLEELAEPGLRRLHPGQSIRRRAPTDRNIARLSPTARQSHDPGPISVNPRSRTHRQPAARQTSRTIGRRRCGQRGSTRKPTLEAIAPGNSCRRPHFDFSSKRYRRLVRSNDAILAYPLELVHAPQLHAGRGICCLPFSLPRGTCAIDTPRLFRHAVVARLHADSDPLARYHGTACVECAGRRRNSSGAAKLAVRHLLPESPIRRRFHDGWRICVSSTGMPGENPVFPEIAQPLDNEEERLEFSANERWLTFGSSISDSGRVIDVLSRTVVKRSIPAPGMRIAGDHLYGGSRTLRDDLGFKE